MLALLALGLVIALPIGLFVITPRLNTTKNSSVDEFEPGKAAPQRSLIVDFETLKTKINDKNTDIATLEKSFNDFVLDYDENTDKIAELRELINKRRDLDQRLASIEAAIKSKTNEIKALIGNSEEPLEDIESKLSVFIADYGEDRKEILELKKLLAHRKKSQEKEASREKTIVEEAKNLIARIHNPGEDLKTLRAAVSEFIISYGQKRKEVPELRRLLSERVEAEEKVTSREAAIVEEAKDLAARIKSRDENLNTIELALSEFVINYGDNRKEIPELRRLIDARREAERLESNIASDTKKLLELLADPDCPDKDLKRLIQEFIDKYGPDREEVSEFNRLVVERKEQQLLEKSIADAVALLVSQFSDAAHPTEELDKSVDDFISLYGEDRKEIPELQRHLKERKATELETKISAEASDLLEQIMNSTATIDFLQSKLDQFITAYGDSRAEIPELTQRLDDRRCKEAIVGMLSKLDSSILIGDVDHIRSVVYDKDYAERLTALTEWSGLVFLHHIQTFQRLGNEVNTEVKINHAVDHMPERELYYRYRMTKNQDDWVITTSEKIMH